MIVLTVVTDPRPVREALRPSKGGSAGQGGSQPVLRHGASARFRSAISKDRSEMGEDASALRRLEAPRATVSHSVYSLDRMRETTSRAAPC